ncbi:hypothetical protein ACWGNZ_19380 (plasmid) [Sphingomonas zeae]
MANEDRQELVRGDKGSDSFSIVIPAKGEIPGIPAELLPELRDQLELIGGWLSCWSYLYGPPLTDEEKAKPEQELAWHTSDFIEEVIKLVGYNQLKEISDRLDGHCAISEIVRTRIEVLDKANAAVSSKPQ